MARIAERTVLAALGAVAMTAALTVATSTPAYAINEVPCAGRDDLVRATIHQTGHRSADYCYANAGEDYYAMPHWWVTRISTGNNRVQWYGDGRWQPAQPIPKYTVFTWPNHPGGVRISGIRIL
ncbi:beta/gamma crystallin domain-containing protein [Nonomuraea sp. SBT364]|uniref:beta/gamma crystallin domain-containing protein n=1 Tax=Nonomuraea sp. SBT364 TaxID=1580530 RepID=UPI00066E927F|nr:beta/gamma crystallin domain-containing protein [Nonomuraea sp. SBT364]